MWKGCGKLLGFSNFPFHTFFPFMPRKRNFPAGISVYLDTNGKKTFWRVRLGSRFLGRGLEKKKTFPTYAEAVAYVEGEMQAKKEVTPTAEALGLSLVHLADARAALGKLSGRATLLEAAEAWIKHEGLESVSVADAIKRLVAHQLTQKAGERHRRETEKYLNRYFEGKMERKLSSITTEELDAIRDAETTKGEPPFGRKCS